MAGAGLAIQWGAVGDVGMLANLCHGNSDDVSIGGTQPQRVRSCLSTLDQFLSQSESAVLSSFVPAESTRTASDTSASSSASPRHVVAHILGHFKHIALLLKA